MRDGFCNQIFVCSVDNDQGRPGTRNRLQSVQGVSRSPTFVKSLPQESWEPDGQAQTGVI